MKLNICYFTCLDFKSCKIVYIREHIDYGFRSMFSNGHLLGRNEKRSIRYDMERVSGVRWR